jgi:hypothetical protein
LSYLEWRRVVISKRMSYLEWRRVVKSKGSTLKNTKTKNIIL